MCRYCYDHTLEPNNPIVYPCDCEGSLKYVHFACLKLWVDSKKTIINQNENVQQILWQQISCEVCKKVYPNT